MHPELSSQVDSVIRLYLIPMGWRIAGALVIWLIGSWAIKLLRSAVRRGMRIRRVDLTLATYLDTSTAYRLWSVTPEDMKRRMAESPPPVALSGAAGTCAIFHCNLMHSSGHNLSRHDRWQAYFCFNTCANRPVDVEKPRPDYVRSTNWAPMQLVEDGAVLASRNVPEPVH